MNVTLNTNRFNSRQYNTFNQNQKRNQQPSFTSGPKDLSSIVTGKSHFYDPMVKLYDNFAEMLSQKVVPHVMDNKFMGWIAEKSKGSNLLFNHFTAIGSLITSGLYMYKTLENKNMDKDRKQTLAINQGLTFAISTVGAYALDKSVDKWWDKVIQKYAGHRIGESNLHESISNKNLEILEFNKTVKNPKEMKQLYTLEKYIEKFHPDKWTENLDHCINGMGLFKKMLIFGMVYRYLVPVLVTPIANKIGEHNLAQKKAKEAEAAKTQNA